MTLQRLCSSEMSVGTDRTAFAPFFFEPPGSTKAFVVAGACGNVGFGKLGQFARLLAPQGIPVVALDVAAAVHEVKDRLREAFGDRFAPDVVDRVLSGIQSVQGGPSDLPATVEIGMVFEAIPERLELKRRFYAAVRERDPDAYIFSATSGLTTQALFHGLPQADRCGVLHPFFPHLTNKLWEVPERGGVTSPHTHQRMRRLFARLGMTRITVADAPAFAADRIFCGMMLEAVRIHAELGLTPAQVDDACKQILGTSPFFVHNLIPGSNYLSAHCMQLLRDENDSTLYAIPDRWRPYIDDPTRQWPYTRGERCPADQLEVVRGRMFGMLLALTVYMLEHDIVAPDRLNYLCENALGFRMGPPALVEAMGHDAAAAVVDRYLEQTSVSAGATVAPTGALAEARPGWGQLYVHTSVHDEVGLISLKRATINDVFVRELDQAYTRLAGDDAIQAIVIAPDGELSREFGHGADPHAFLPILGDYEPALALIQRWKATLAKLRGGKPTVAALVGRVLGGGLELACHCHARIAAEGTWLAQPEPTVGVIPGLGGCHQIHRLCAEEATTRINELLLTGDRFTATEAVALGLVQRAVPVADLRQASLALAASLARGQAPIPPFRRGPAQVTVDRGVNHRNESGAVHDAKLRQLLADTIEATNGLSVDEASSLEEQRAATSLTMSSSRIGVRALIRGKSPQFEHPIDAASTADGGGQ
ncbi:MAG: hypothetical protein B7733_00990 [Myxococcales bacterium FL481]|nr:MAG: hypothetical protein B7733_00990 [Myxococcales bacterium FL481]